MSPTSSSPEPNLDTHLLSPTLPEHNNITFLFLNIQGYPKNSQNNKIPQIQKTLENLNPDIFLAIESNAIQPHSLSPYHDDYQLSQNNFTDSSDPHQAIGKGIVLFSKKGTIVQQILPKSNTNRILLTTIRLSNKNHLIITAFHISPHNEEKKQDLNKMIILLDLFQQRYKDTSIIGYADLNIDKNSKKFLKISKRFSDIGFVLFIPDSITRKPYRN